MKNTAKILIIFFLTVLFTIGAVGLKIDTARGADCDNIFTGEYWDNAGDCLLGGGDKSGSTSFTDFKGGLTTPSTAGYDPSLTQTTSAREFILRIVNFSLGFLGLIAIVIIIYGGFRYVLAGGESEGVEKGKKSILYAVIGIIIIAGSFAIVNTVLKAPSGTDRDITATEPEFGATPGTISGALGGSYGNQILNLSRQLLDTYSRYGSSKFSMDAIERSLETAWTKTGFKSFDDGLTALTEIENRWNDIQIELDKIANRSSGLSTVRDRVAEQKLFVGFWLEKATEEAKNRTDSVENYYNNFTNKWNELIKIWKEGPTPGATKKCLVSTTKPSDDVVLQGLGACGVDGSLKSLLTDIEKEKVEDLKKIKKDIGLIRDTLKETLASDSANPADVVKLLTDTLENMETLKTSTDIKSSKETLKQVVQTLAQVYENLKNLKSVKVKLTANTYEGNSPLIVNFSTVGSNDPSEKSIAPEKIQWFPGVTCGVAQGGIQSCPLEKNVECTPSDATAACTFKKAGSYKIGVKIKSSDPAKFATGIGFVSINVKPPSGQINLTYKTADSQAPKYAIRYKDEGTLIQNQDILYVAGSIASQGIEFDASETKDALQFKWNCGNGKGEITGSAEETSMKTAKCIYDKEGRYRFLLEVTAKDGSINRKILEIIVAKISVSIDLLPGSTVRTGAPVEIRGNATSDRGRVSGEWNASSESPDGEKDKIQGTEETLHITLDKPGKYVITYKAENEFGDSAVAQADLEVESNPPVAKFKVTARQKNSPADFIFDASLSYDPDGPNDGLTYKWEIEGEKDKDYKFVEGDETAEKPVIRFLKKGEYSVKVIVEDKNESGKTSFDQQTLEIINILNIEWPPENPATGQLDNTQQVAFTFTVKSGTAANFDMDFGDSEVESGVFASGKAEIKHIYKEAGTYQVKVTVLDEEGNRNSLTRRVIIGRSDKPLAMARVFMGNEEIETSETIIIDRKTVITFDASQSKNIKGENKGLKYSWNFGDGKKSTKENAAYIYKEISPANPGFYNVTLTVTDEEDATKNDLDNTIKILVANKKPTMKSMVVIPQSQDLKTPLSVMVKVLEPKDADGQIVTYKWWYSDVRFVDTPIATKITTTPSVIFNIGTRGEEGALVDFIFDMEMKDEEGQVVKASDLLNKQKQQPTISVINGPNKMPVAKFSVDRTSIIAGETINFSSNSTDADGQIEYYLWDTEGDGFQNNDETKKSTVTAQFVNPAPLGIKVKLKVIDNNFGEAASDPVTIYILPASNPPTADFAGKQIPATYKVTFGDKSRPDTTKNVTITSWTWDFNTLYDSDGDGKKDNDQDVAEKNPVNEYPAPGKYTVKLTVKDSAGSSGFTTRQVSVEKLPEEKLPEVKKNPATLTPGSSGLKSAVESQPKTQPYFPASEPTASPGTPSSPAPKPPSSSYPSFPVAARPLDAKLITKPDINLIDGKIHIKGTVGNVEFDYSGSKGNIAHYEIDKNIYFDTDGNGVKDDDADHSSQTAGKWTTDFKKEWGKIGIKLSIFDAAGNKDSVLREITFDKGFNSGANNIFVIPGVSALYGALASMAGFGILAFRRKKRRLRRDI